MRDGDEYVINGHKWYISGAIRPECKVFIFMGRSNSDPNVHKQQSMIIVPRDAHTSGVGEGHAKQAAVTACHAV